MKHYILSLLMLVSLIGCETTSGSGGRNGMTVGDLLGKQVLEGLPPIMVLSVLAEVHRQAWGQWPDSIDELEDRVEPSYDFEQFENVTFSTVSDTQMLIEYGDDGARSTITVKHNPGDVNPFEGLGITDPNFKIRLYD